MAMIKMLRPSSMFGKCDECRAVFDPVYGGVCSRCKRLLCGRHIYGSIFRRIQAWFGVALVCTVCRSGAIPKALAGER